jgi:hypothetical protein
VAPQYPEYVLHQMVTVMNHGEDVVLRAASVRLAFPA